MEWLPLLFPFLFIPFWCGVCWMIALFGWKSLAERYATPSRPIDGETFHCRTVSLNYFANYNGVITMNLSSAGLFLQPMIFFRVGHPPLLIPWTEITLEKQGFFQSRVRVGNPSVATLLFSKRLLAKAIEKGYLGPITL